MFLQSVIFILAAVLVVCAVGETGHTAAASASATTTSATTTSSGRFDSLSDLSGNLANEISAYFAQLLPSATDPPTPVEINELLDIVIDGRIYPPVIYDGSAAM